MTTRTTISINPGSYGSGSATIDTTNGNHFDLSVSGSPSGPGVGRLADLYPMHVYVNNTAGAGTATLKNGYGPWGSVFTDLAISIPGTAVTDIGPQITRAYARDPFGSFDIDWTTVTGTVWVVWGNAMAIPANSVGAYAVKPAPTSFLGAVVTATGTAGETIYDSYSTPAGTALLTVSANPALGFLGAGNPKLAVNGIVAGGVANAPALTLLYS